MLLLAFLFPLSAHAQKKERPRPPLAVVKDTLVYTPDSSGNRIPDFSYCGYLSGEQAIPHIPSSVFVPHRPGDATSAIQSAIDHVSTLKPDASGFRGAVLLDKGSFEVSGTLRVHTSGVVLRGSGRETIILGAGKDRATLVEIEGKYAKVITNDTIRLTDSYVPVNATTFTVSSTRGLSVGKEIDIIRLSTQEWINTLGTDHFGGGITSLGWKPGSRNIVWRRTIRSIDGNKVTVDAPITTAIDQQYGGGRIVPANTTGRLERVGIENLQLQSSYDATNIKDEDHRWMAITINHARDGWVRQLSFRHFAGSAVALYEHASRFTIEDCISTEPVSEIGGERRNTFFTSGQLNLFQRCYARNGIHDFALGFSAPGPNAFVQCESSRPYSFSGGLDSWASGVLFDIVKVDGHAISFSNLGQNGQGAGWNVANSVLWNCSASRIDCFKPPTAQNWSFGSWSQFSGDGYWGESNNSIQPRSLYYAQLFARTGRKVEDAVMDIGSEASSSPSINVAAQLTLQVKTPANTLESFIRNASTRNPISTKPDNLKRIDVTAPQRTHQNKTPPPLAVSNGWLSRGGIILTGKRMNVPWWNGSAKSYLLSKMSPAITRFVPGRKGTGLTDVIQEVVDSMIAEGSVALDHNYGLWYDRRRDDHERIRRIDGDVWPPFYELPFARSGKDTAWDGLSKYDLTKWNEWYWLRLRKFAELADQHGLVLFHQNYFQHNIIEAGAHYSDFPWRPVNNINNTGFPEPVAYAGDKRIFMAEEFYDTAHVVRRQLHRNYIRQCLDNFTGASGVIQFTSEEYTGPLHFVQFWLNTVREWKRETNKPVLIALSATKDVQDAILADPGYADLVDVIDIKYWHYQSNGTAYAPKGGQNLAPRQHARLGGSKGTDAKQVYRAVSEYRTNNPGKAVLYSAPGSERFGWAVLLAGGSLPEVNFTNKEFLKDISDGKPTEKDGTWLLSGSNAIVAFTEERTINIEVPAQKSTYDVRWINTQTAELKTGNRVNGGKKHSFTPPAAGKWILWLHKRK